MKTVALRTLFRHTGVRLEDSALGTAINRSKRQTKQKEETCEERIALKRQAINTTRRIRGLSHLTMGMLLVGASGIWATPTANDPAARFRGAPTYDFGVTNVKWEAATPDYSYVTFDLYWSYSWRAQWVEPARTSATGKDLEVENWDAAWVFVKFLAEPDEPMNYWRHVSLANDTSLHVMPTGATNSVRLSDDGSRGIGVFIYRDAIGHGINDWKGVRLRWQHGVDQVDPAKAKIAVHPIAMVYVPEGPFKVGMVRESGFSKFSDGPDMPIARYDGEQAFGKLPSGLRNVIETTTRTDGGPYLRWDANPPHVSAITRLTDGGWRGGPTIPFLVDAVWNAPTKPGTTARNIGPVAGQLWSTHTFAERGGGGGWFSSHIGGVGPLNNDYPTGYEAFYCMKYPLTQGQYVDFLNSLAPDVAAARAFVSGEISTTAGSMHVHEIKVDQGPGFQPYIVKEMGGLTITSSADMREKIPLAAESTGTEEEGQDANPIIIGLANELMVKKQKKKDTEPTLLRPVYSARCPFRRCIGVDGADARAYAVWAGLRPMTMLENVKASIGPRDPTAPDDTAATRPDLEGDPVMLDFGLPTERFAKGDSHYSADLATRVGCRATPTSDRGAALATYWGISELSGPAVPLENRGFRGTHGDGTMPTGTPGASFKRRYAEFTAKPADWPNWGHYGGNRHVSLKCQLVASAIAKAQADKSAERLIGKPEQQPTAANPPVEQAASQSAKGKRVDIPRVTNVQWEAGTRDYSTVTFDLAWDNSWRAVWTEPAEKNVTGKPLKVESWDAAWVFVKFREADATDDTHATLSAKASDHSVPAGAALNVGLDDDGSKGIGVFIYRSAAGVGANSFKGVKLRLLHGDKADPGKAEWKVHSLAMVYLPEGPFASRSPWGHPLKIITTPDARKPEGHLDSDPETVPYFAEWPNGYSAFYCMKYSISQGQYVEFLNSVPSGKYNSGRYGLLGHGNFRRFSSKTYNVLGYTITTNEAGVFQADEPDRFCKLLSNPDILSFTAWAGLRPLTNLEYEKACRGPRAVARGAEAWAPATCAPAVGLDKAVLDAPTAVGPGPSYWGIRELSLSGCVQEWPGMLQREPAVVKKRPSVKTEGRLKDEEQLAAEADQLAQQDEKRQNNEYRGGHGSGSPEAPKTWPLTFFGDWYYGGIWRLWGYGTVAQWVDPSELGSYKWDWIDACRTGRYGARAVRTAPPVADANAALQLDPLPGMVGYDIGIFHLSGRFRNNGVKPLRVEVSAPLPEACFPEGAASRAFTAAPNAETRFRVLTMLTRVAVAGNIQQTRTLPVRILALDATSLSRPGSTGRDAASIGVLAEQTVQLLMADSKYIKPPVIRSFEGGEVSLRVLNATDRPRAVAITLTPPPGVTMPDPERRVELAAGAEGRATFPIPRQALAGDGVRRLPYRVTLTAGAPQGGETTADLRALTRWWVGRTAKKGPSLDQSAVGREGQLGAIASVIAESVGLSDLPADLFKRVQPPGGWEQAVCGTGLPLGAPLSRGSSALAATRVLSLGERAVVISVQHKASKIATGRTGRDPRFIVRIWLNNELVFNSRATGTQGGTKPFNIHKGENTLVVGCQSEEDVSADPGTISVQFQDAKDGKDVGGLVWDIEGR